MILLVEKAAASLNREYVSALRVFEVLNPHVNSLGKNLACNLLVYNDAHGMLAGIVDSSYFVMVTLIEHST